MQIVATEEQLRTYLKTAVELGEDKPVLVDKYIFGKEVEVDAILPLQEFKSLHLRQPCNSTAFFIHRPADIDKHLQ